MKQLLFLNIIIAVLSSPAQAVTVSAFGEYRTSSAYGSFSTSPGGTPISESDLATIVSNDIDTFVMSNDAEASFELDFGSNTVTTGAGADLVIFTIGNGYSFGMQVFGTGDADNPISSYIYSVPVPSASYDATVYDKNGDPLCVNDTLPCPAVISGTAIDIFDSSFNYIADDTEIDFIRIFLGNDYNGSVGGETAYPLFSLAGAVYSDAVVVPLPLPAVLFSSGLLLLGWVGRRKTV
jgi:hypothetical protein